MTNSVTVKHNYCKTITYFLVRIVLPEAILAPAAESKRPVDWKEKKRCYSAPVLNQRHK